jgi:vancomycin permeability regulator SanA
MKGIIVLGASDERMRERIKGAISLYLQNHEKSLLILSGYDWKSFNISSLIKRYGISPEKILIEEKSRTTLENAIYSKNVVKKTGVEEIAVVSDSFHMARVKKIFNDHFKGYKKNFYAVQLGLKLFSYLPSEILSCLILLFDKRNLITSFISSYREHLQSKKLEEG